MSGVAGPASELEEGLIASCISIQSYDSVMPREGQNVARRGTGKCDMLSHVSTIRESLQRPFLVQVMLDFKGDGSAVLFQSKRLYSNSSTIPVTPENPTVAGGPLWGNGWPILLPAASVVAGGGGSSLVQRKEERFGEPKGIGTTRTQPIQGNYWKLCSLAQDFDRKVVSNITARTDREFKIFCSRA